MITLTIPLWSWSPRLYFRDHNHPDYTTVIMIILTILLRSWSHWLYHCDHDHTDYTPVIMITLTILLWSWSPWLYYCDHDHPDYTTEIPSSKDRVPKHARHLTVVIARTQNVQALSTRLARALFTLLRGRAALRLSLQLHGSEYVFKYDSKYASNGKEPQTEHRRKNDHQLKKSDFQAGEGDGRGGARWGFIDTVFSLKCYQGKYLCTVQTNCKFTYNKVPTHKKWQGVITI